MSATQTMTASPTPQDSVNSADAFVCAREIPLAQIVPNPRQPRRHFDDDSLLELAESIAQHGILQPLLLRPIAPDRYEIIAGERRFRAAQLVGLTTVPALIKTLTDREQAELALIENLQREDLSPVEIARAFRILMNEFGLTQQQIAERTGKSPSLISRMIHLLKLPDEIMDSLEQGELQARHARALLRVKNKEVRDRLCHQVLENRLLFVKPKHWSPPPWAKSQRQNRLSLLCFLPKPRRCALKTASAPCTPYRNKTSAQNSQPN